MTDRTAFRTAATLAGRILPVHYPVEAFIAVNPLGGMEDLPFDNAVAAAQHWFGAPGTLPEQAYRSAYHAGRINDDDLRTALDRALPGVSAEPDLMLGERRVPVIDLLRADLLHAPPSASEPDRAGTRSAQRAPDVAVMIDAQTGKWCAAFAGGHAGWSMPGREQGFYQAWRHLAHRDPTLPRQARACLKAVPANAEDAAWQALERLGIADDDVVDYLRAHLTALPGWAAYARWCGERAAERPGLDLVGYLAMRLTYEAALLDVGKAAQPEARPLPRRVQSASPRRRAAIVAAALAPDVTDDQLAAAERALTVMTPVRRGMVWLDAYEEHYRRALLRQLSANPPAESEPSPDAQLVCCIDARSEGLRRHVEALGNYETFGFAGFFAVAMRFRDLAGGHERALCPALVEPDLLVAEVPAAGARTARRQVDGLRWLAQGDDSFHAAKDHPLSPFILAEAAGWAAVPIAAIRTAFPAAAATLRQRIRAIIAPPASTNLNVNESVDLAHRVLYAQAALMTMGLTRFAALVVLCAHGSSTENNPYQAALDCGACGGHRGGPNARALAAILNDPEVRHELAAKGITIPTTTWFVAAEHDTTTDTIHVLDAHAVPQTWHPALTQVSEHLTAAGRLLARERCDSLPIAARSSSVRAARRHVIRRATDWAQVYPEWGLAGNAAFIVGPRGLTAGLNLQRRAFLHSYDASIDSDGTALETILTAPLVVAQWINSQYYFSTVAPHVFGAGTKTIHNAVAGIGVLAGHTGDLRLGLPWQSVAIGQHLVHEPMRLLAVVEAPLARLDTIIGRNPVLQRLFGNDWVALVARERPGQPWQRRTRAGWLLSAVPATTKE